MNFHGPASALTCLLTLSTLTAAGNPKKDIIETATAAGSFKTLLTAVRAAGLEDALRADGPFTVFAPTDAAFAKLPTGTLQTLLDPANRAALKAILEFHVVAGKIDAASALSAGTAQSLEKSVLRIALREGRLQVQGATVIENDIETSNGVIHVIDSVLLPPVSGGSALIDITATGLIESAINRGVPLFNQGQQAACAAVYEITIRGLLQSKSVGMEQRSALAKSLRKAATESPTDAAWTLRHAMDQAYLNLSRNMKTEARQPDSAPTGETRTLRKRSSTAKSIFEFEAAAEANRFRPLNDTVMGGRSSSRMEAGEATAIFTGRVSLENNGGFASVRAPIRRGSLADSEGVVMRVRGDGRTYRFTARKGNATYDANFQSEKGEWTEVQIPFADLRRNIRGFRPNTRPPMPRDLDSIGILIGDKKAGPFRLEIDWIRAYGD